jgi:GTP-binding protein EngB required for normal cell division
MTSCLAKFKKKKSSSQFTDIDTVNIDTIPHEIVYSTSEKKILQFVNSTNELLEQITSHDVSKTMNIQKINIPRLVLTGTQSSGKSSIVNRFIGMNILPTGDNMVTRTPINIRLSTVTNTHECIASIYIYIEGNKEIIHSTQIENINIQEFQKKIIEATNRITDNSFSISSSQIFIDINSFNVENMTIIDLPGIVSIPCTDKGQPATIVEDIKNLIIEQLEQPETYVLAVVSALVDLEADSGLAIIKSVQRINPKLRAVGVLTKSDGLKSVSKLNKIINNDENISKDLMLNDGYFVVNNLIPDNSEWYPQTFDLTSSIIRRKRYGILNLKSHLKKVLMAMIKEKLPTIQTNLQNIHRELNIITPKLDDNLDKTIGKLLFINNMMYIMSKGISESFNSLGIWRNVGNNISNTFDSFVKETNLLDPFSTTLFPDTELSNIISNFSGYIPNANDKTYLVVNRCLTDESRQPIKLILPHAEKCISTLVKIITHLIDDFLRMVKLDIYPLNLNKYNISLNNFPKLRNFILENTIELLNVYSYRTSNNINHLLSIHERHLVWYDQKDFDDYYSKYEHSEHSTAIENIIDMDGEYEKNNTSIKLKHDPDMLNVRNPTVIRMRILLKICFNKIVKTCQDEIYKTIASDIVKEFEHHFFIELNTKFIQMTEEKLNELFYETDDFIKNKKIYDNMTSKVEQLLKQSEELK